jgi:hypothetical protein
MGFGRCGRMVVDDCPAVRRLAVDEGVARRQLHQLPVHSVAECVKATGDRGITKEIDLFGLHRRLQFRVPRQFRRVRLRAFRRDHWPAPRSIPAMPVLERATRGGEISEAIAPHHEWSWVERGCGQRGCWRPLSASVKGGEEIPSGGSAAPGSPRRLATPRDDTGGFTKSLFFPSVGITSG